MHNFAPHDHEKCISVALSQAEMLCKNSNLKLTKVRRRVLEILLSSHKAKGAYEILDVLRTEGLGSQPPVVYRALEFLIDAHLVHRVEKMNAYVACSMPEAPHHPALLICSGCNQIGESTAGAVGLSLGSVADADGFDIEAAVVEATGLCPECRKSA